MAHLLEIENHETSKSERAVVESYVKSEQEMPERERNDESCGAKAGKQFVVSKQLNISLIVR